MKKTKKIELTAKENEMASKIYKIYNDIEELFKDKDLSKSLSKIISNVAIEERLTLLLKVMMKEHNMKQKALAKTTLNGVGQLQEDKISKILNDPLKSKVSRNRRVALYEGYTKALQKVIEAKYKAPNALEKEKKKFITENDFAENERSVQIAIQNKEIINYSLKKNVGSLNEIEMYHAKSEKEREYILEKQIIQHRKHLEELIC